MQHWHLTSIFIDDIQLHSVHYIQKAMTQTFAQHFTEPQNKQFLLLKNPQI